MVFIKIKKNRLFCDDFAHDNIFALSCGILLMRGIPAAAISAGWELSIMIGPTAGDIFAVLIFLLGVSAINITEEISNIKLTKTAMLITSVLYVLVSGESYYNHLQNESNHIITFLSGMIDCAAILLILNKQTYTEKKTHLNIIVYGILLSLWCIITLIGFPAMRAEVFHPPLAALLSGTALSGIIRADNKPDLLWLLLGMASVLLFDAIF